MHITLNIERQIEQNSLSIIQDNTINEMVQANSHRFNTLVKRMSTSVVIIIITRFLATCRISTQYFNHLFYKIVPPVHSKLISHHHISNYAIYGLDIWKLI